MIHFIYSILCFLLLTGCQSNKEESSCRFYDDGKAKPTVTLIPIIDSTCYDIPWSLSEEFTHMIKKNLIKNGNIYIPQNNEFILSSTINPFSNNLSWLKDKTEDEEFIILLELIEHKEVPISKTMKKAIKLPESKKRAYNLDMAMRIRVIDVRKTTPKIIMQEKIEDSFYVPNNIERTNYNITTYGTHEYKSSPMGKIHKKFSQKLTKRISDYISIAKSR
ncbi:MAG: hypothetical protein AMS24_04425 [Chlamydiae bacterium SM23_39]|nr:MAG: hypothetical protein AMS24_04425 [Chlamydiae bacterium SM23_39]